MNANPCSREGVGKIACCLFDGHTLGIIHVGFSWFLLGELLPNNEAKNYEASDIVAAGHRLDRWSRFGPAG
jgi:hypothetical protein